MKQYFTKSTIIISLISLGIGFAAGFFFQKSRTPSFGGNKINGIQMGNGGPQGQVRGAKTGNNGSITQTSNLKQTIGEISKIDDSSVTIKTPDGGSKIVLISDSTIINKAVQGSKTDLVTGSNISVTGDSSTDGSITSKTININSDKN